MPGITVHADLSSFVMFETARRLLTFLYDAVLVGSSVRGQKEDAPSGLSDRAARGDSTFVRNPSIT